MGSLLRTCPLAPEVMRCGEGSFQLNRTGVRGRGRGRGRRRRDRGRTVIGGLVILRCLFLLLRLLASLSDQFELSEHACVHILVVRDGVVAVTSCGGGIWAGAPALAPAAGVITDALIAALVTPSSAKSFARRCTPGR